MGFRKGVSVGRTFADELNTKFAKKAKEERDYHQRDPKDFRLHEVFSFEETHVPPAILNQ